MKPTLLPIALLSSYAMTTQAAEKLSTVTVSPVQQQTTRDTKLKLKDDVIHTEVISAKKIAQKQAASIAQAIENEPGVKVSTDCSMCGVKRVMLNGLKGEHTTILMNGVPNSSMTEGFYGFDAIPTAGVTNIEIARGAGASLIAPEAIGGVVNIVTEKPQNDMMSFDMAKGSNQYHKYQFISHKLSHDNKTAIAFGAQSDKQGQVDVDNNLVNESPELSNRALNMHIWHQINQKDSIDFRVEDQRSEVFGGPMIGTSFARSKSAARVESEGNADFEGGNVSNKPTSGTTAKDFLENIESNKQAYTAKWNHEVSPDLQTRVTASQVSSKMDAIYEGHTYEADQEIYYLDARANYFVNEEHEILFGLDYKIENMNSTSTGGTNAANDAYKMNTAAFYIRDFWTPTNAIEVSLALRADQLNIQFTDQDRKFNESLLAPRMHLRYLHDFNWTSRFSAGQGYRVPLAFYETEHGILDAPLDMQVDKLEKSNSMQYSLDFNGATTSFETSYSWTSVDNLVQLEEASNKTRVVNSSKTGTVQHINVLADHQLTANWAIGAAAEAFLYDKAYRETFGVIPVEERIRLFVDFEKQGWDVVTSLTWIGSRDYADYTGADYGNHFEDKANTTSKGTTSPSYFTVDMKISKTLNKHWTVYAGGTNLTDYTQTGEGSSPLFYDDAGAVDVGHIWGPLRGRELYAGVKANF